ncbi:MULTISPECIES: bifunctional DNA-formamidopyrimidine glycosylase/DNA-(apurinic or apyrimidinic site) lyase [unclassified Saccharopolyspora]|uniref:bifunctional DNA-formamidopyrimidine glycosylase/DNA-(apurinic or apyrimidinic site) lyase n=1 Tax=unclassified Saccharopolyspora TaxID=2646250 RepID=UPI001CD725CE|nr:MULTISPECIES: bifunctional DNA-formamidopyrimidine glycosylase/DNA-(apurinic or apyrimidinic site) lyase [unclassified Saccharopolyspora]MCA1187772.1 bifunctional DNA-formamidopyrimidine glycosylase/DNA-(apurinic or apyrimidinic site) lyase [Saccharopolyspora sp. 6T]MCA1190983.1 bifunctional DNA-formamidopyrimidine glycosylase/DNA-(apurinic or apyrimidinic site) lyase [Saccharopolyspora sp. 6V]MCA1279838.1 bifunctional DNA-formamidopyrimidine glycosylase/DNA-(apurinic or apyrimidinic site) ly
MPELPEVEVVRRGVAEHVTGRTVSAVDVLHPRAVRRHVPGPEDFAARLAGRTVHGVRRRGKYLWLVLDEDAAPQATEFVGTADAPGEALLTHLGMSGQLLVQPVGTADEKHLRVRFAFADGGPELRFVDQRTFGGLALADQVEVGGVLLPTPVAHIAPDPLEEAFDVDAVVAKLRSRRTGVKRALLDQSLISGVGNIYADEALWRAKLHWARPTATLTRPEVRALLAAVTEVMGEALQVGGTSFDALYVNVNGESGYFDRSLAVYGQAERPCPRCGAVVRRDAFMNRSSYSCPVCQPEPRNAHR